MNKTISVTVAALLLTALFMFTGCTDANETQDAEASVLQTTGINSPEVDVQYVQNKISSHDNFILLDVRTPEENTEKSIKNSVLIPLDQLNENNLTEKGINKDDVIIIYCRSGNRSMTAYNELIKLDFTNVKSMAGGIKAWEAKNFPVCSATNPC